MSSVGATIKPRKTAAQARSAATVEALHVATIQILTRDGLARCTTTRIAERAGVSVGSLYQYYPNRDALLAAVMQKHLDAVAAAVERACETHRAASASQIAVALVRAFLGAKLQDAAESRALYAIAGERGGAQIVARMHARMAAAVAALLASASDMTFGDPAVMAAIAIGAMTGPVRSVLEGHAPDGVEAGLEEQLILLLTAYLQSRGAPR